MILMLSMSALGAWAQVGGLTQTGDMTVCLNSTWPYGVMVNLTPGSTYTWSITTPSTGGTGIITDGAFPNNLISINWTSAGTCTLVVTEKNASGCSAIINSILITVQPLMIAGAASSAPTLCINTALTAITHATTRATGIGAPTGLPAGVTATWANDVITISGTPTESGPFNYTIPLTGGCGTINATGTIIVNALPPTSPIYHN